MGYSLTLFVNYFICRFLLLFVILFLFVLLSILVFFPMSIFVCLPKMRFWTLPLIISSHSNNSVSSSSANIVSRCINSINHSLQNTVTKLLFLIIHLLFCDAFTFPTSNLHLFIIFIFFIIHWTDSVHQFTSFCQLIFLTLLVLLQLIEKRSISSGIVKKQTSVD